MPGPHNRCSRPNVQTAKKPGPLSWCIFKTAYPECMSIDEKNKALKIVMIEAEE